MSCFTLGGSYRQRKKKITATFMENEIYIPCEKTSNTSEKSRPSDSIADDSSNRKETERTVFTTNSVLNPGEVICCTTSAQSSEKTAIKNSVRCIKRKKRKAPLPPNVTNLSEKTHPQINDSKEIEVNKIDDLPTAIGKLYTFNQLSINSQQISQEVPNPVQKQEISVICQGRYARVLEEKKINDLNVGGKNTPKKRKSPKKKPAPKPPLSSKSSSYSSINISNNFNEIVNVNGDQLEEFSRSNVVKNSIENKELCICNCAMCKEDNFKYINIPHFVCPTLSKDADSYNVTVLGYFSIGKKDENYNEEIKLHENGFHHCCEKDIAGACISNNVRISQNHDFVLPLPQQRKCRCNCSPNFETIEHFDQNHFNELPKRKINLCTKSHSNPILMCSCSNPHWLTNENDEYVGDNIHRKMMFNRHQNPLIKDCSHKNYKSKYSYQINKRSEQFTELEELLKSRPSVSDFIAAFNYLTQRNSDLDLPNPRISSENNLKINRVQESVTDCDEYDLKSLPTKWKYAPMDFNINKVKATKLEESYKINKPLKSCLVNKNNKKVTFENGIKSRESVKLATKIDALPQGPCNYYIAAHKHARNQEYINQKDRFKKTSFNENDLNLEAKKPIRNQRLIRNHNYRKSYRAPPIPNSENYNQNLSSCQNKKNSLEKIDEYGAIPKKYNRKIWVSLYIEDKSSHKGLIPLLISPTMTLGMLKDKLERQFGYPRYLQRWILGKCFATDDDSTLAEYDVVEEGCPVFLYMTEKNPQNEYENFAYNQNNKTNDSTNDDSDSDSDISLDSDSGTVILASDTDMLSESSESSGTKSIDLNSHTSVNFTMKNEHKNEILSKTSLEKKEDTSYKVDVAKENYKRWMEIDDQDLIKNLEYFDCPICFIGVEAGEGIMLKDCLHLFCRECLSNTVLYSEEAVIKCPFRNDEYSCNSYLQEREIKALVSPEIFERHLQRSIAAAESQAKNSFHCKTPDCPGWCLYEDKVNLFLCPVCSRLNCLTCQVIHEGRNCRQYQDELEFNSTTSDEAKKTKDYLDEMLVKGEAMRCPRCHIVLMKKWGCDWLKCSVCLTEICWVTKGCRWGPGGRGDTSGGCKCGVNGIRCHPKCNYCH
ncbi:uncharacterized protein LOC111614336 [Centruroides sculpturatus]|uniref:uncharacterized protein LOC111614336 n=2 Tax=Centruroides sculpturatus TaxID=218467 RepID=UPI000C6E5B49|nr:uncharacterized protein LOC111614336 [Centruroides sculpturatus]